MAAPGLDWCGAAQGRAGREVSEADRSGVPVWEGDVPVCVFCLENFLWLWLLRLGWRVADTREEKKTGWGWEDAYVEQGGQAGR